MIFSHIQSVKSNKLIQEEDIPIVDFQIVNGKLDFMEIGPINDTEQLQIIRVLGSKELNISVVLFLLYSFSEVGSDKVRVVGLWVGKFGKFSLGDCSEICVDFVLDDFGNSMTGEIEVEENVGERLVVIVDVDSQAVDNRQTVV